MRGRFKEGAAIAMLVLVGGCAVTSAPSPGGATSAASDATASEEPDASPTPLAGLPMDIVGSWETDLRDHLDDDEIDFNIGPEVRLIIRAEGRATLSRSASQASFTLSVRDDLIVFERVLRAGDTPCGMGVYRWERNGDTLTLTAVEPDDCERRREAIDGIPFTLAD